MLSVTTLSSYLYCPRKLYLTNVLKLVEPPKKALVTGTIRHSVHEDINNSEESIVSSITKDCNSESITSLYLTHFKKALRSAIMKNKFRLKQVAYPLLNAYEDILPFFEKESAARAERVHSFMLHNKVYGLDLWESLIPKIKSEIRIESPTLELKGIVDQLQVYPNKLIPIELKTGKAPNGSPWPGHKIQIGAYMLLISEKFNVDIDVGTIHYLDDNVKFDVTMNLFFKQEIIELKDTIKKLLSSEVIPPICKNTNKCNACSLKSKCYGL